MLFCSRCPLITLLGRWYTFFFFNFNGGECILLGVAVFALHFSLRLLVTIDGSRSELSSGDTSRGNIQEMFLREVVNVVEEGAESINAVSTKVTISNDPNRDLLNSILLFTENPIVNLPLLELVHCRGKFVKVDLLAAEALRSIIVCIENRALEQ